VKLAVALRWLERETRGARGHLAFFVACLAIGVAAVVAVAGLSASLREGIRGEARQLLAADLAIAGRRPLPRDLRTAAPELARAERTDLTQMVTVVSVPPRDGRPGPSQLVELKAVGGTYPFYGKLVTVPARPLSELLRPDTAVVASELLARLGLRVGDTLQIGGAPFRIAGTVSSEPDRISISMTLGPRLFLSQEGLARTALAGRGSRLEHRALFRLPPQVDVEALAKRLRASFPDSAYYRVETYKEAQPGLRDSISRVERYLGLVALLSLFIGGIGVAQSVRAWLASRLDPIAVLKCLGVRPRELFLLYLAQTVLLGLAGSAVGIGLGVGLQWLLPRLFSDLIPGELVHLFQPWALLRGLALGIGVAVLFSLPALAAVLRVPPLRVFRRDAEPLPVHRLATALTLVGLAAGVLGMATLQSGSWLLGARFTGGMAGVTALLAAAAWGLSRLVRRLPRESIAPWLRHGLAALARPGAATLGAIVALGLGVLVVLGMSLVERRIQRDFARELPKDAPTAFLIDIQPDQWPGVRRLLVGAGAQRIESVPVVMARIKAIDGAGVESLAAVRSAKAAGEEERGGGGRGGGGRDGNGGRRWALTREQRLTYLEKLPADNQIVAGALWSDPARSEVSLEEEFARDLGAHLGSVLTFDVQGVPFDLVVTSLRKVDWRTFGINFFLVVEPGVLDDAPQQRLAVAHLPPGSEQRTQDLLAASYPNVTLLRIREILDKVTQVLSRIALAVRFLGGFTVVAGIAILAGAITASSSRRGREVALLKTLGMTRQGVIATFAVEYALVGLVAGLIGTGSAVALAREVIVRGFKLDWQVEPLPLAVSLAASVLLAVVAGLAASARALAQRPIEALRQE
jgi:putative ABC transport system permease protein